MKKILTTIAIALAVTLSTIICYSAMVDYQQNVMCSIEEISSTPYIPVQEINQPKETFARKIIREEIKKVFEEPETTKTIDTNNILVNKNQYGLELPINGATGYTSTKLDLYSNENRNTVLMTLDAGTAFRIIDEIGDLWYIQIDDTYGYVEHLLCMINLPDVIPSIVYYNSNSDHSLYMSRGNELKNVTSEKLYNTYFFNERFAEKQYAMPVLYRTSKLICDAQSLALQNGYTLVIYEAFRPADTQRQVRDALRDLINNNSDVKAHTEDSFGLSWFIAKSTSNHQVGYAIDVTLADVISAQYDTCGDYNYVHINEYVELEMPTSIHELSDDSAVFSYGISSRDKNAWKSAPLATSMNDSAMLLQAYCTESGMTPLASEWWHFNDLDTMESIGKRAGNGQYYISSVVSIIPE